MNRFILIAILVISLGFSQDLSAQYFTQSQIDSVRINNVAQEGDFYIDSANNNTYLGLPDGSIAALGVSGNLCNLLSPKLTSGQVVKAGPSTTDTLTLRGFNFSETMTIQVVGQTVNGIISATSGDIQFSITTGAGVGSSDIIVTNDCGSDTLVNGFEIKSSAWIDLRAGGASFSDGNGAGNDIRYRSGMSMVRNGTGMYFTGSNPWSSWVKFESEQFTRGNSTSVEWILRVDGSMMIGISGITTDENSTSQWGQGAVVAYFNNATNMWGYYGSAPSNGSSWFLSDGQSISSGAVIKVKIESDGESGATLNVYEIPSEDPSDWDDESNLVNTTVSTNTNTQTPIVPFIIPRNSANTRVIALRVF